MIINHECVNKDAEYYIRPVLSFFLSTVFRRRARAMAGVLGPAARPFPVAFQSEF